MASNRLLARAGREVRDVVRAETATHRHLRERLLVAAIVTVALDLVATLVIYFVERHAQGSDIRTISSAAFWTSTQLFTISSSLSNPVSPAARLIDVGLELYAVTVVAAIAGSFGAFVHRRASNAIRSRPRRPRRPPARRAPRARAGGLRTGGSRLP